MNKQQNFKDRPGKREEITDLMSLEARKHYNVTVGSLLIFSRDGVRTPILVTRMTKERMWGVHVTTEDRQVVYQHRHHAVDTTEEAFKEYGGPFCTDCMVPVSEPATEDGDVKAADRADRTLSDGTIIE